MKKVVYSDSVTSIPDNAFWGNRLTDLVIPDSVTSIGKGAKYNLLMQVVIPDSVTSIGDDAFSGNKSTMSYGGIQPGLTEVVIPDSVNSIGKSAF